MDECAYTYVHNVASTCHVGGDSAGEREREREGERERE